MKEVALYDAKNTLSALVQEVEETGQEVVITRHGKPAVRIAPLQASALHRQADALRRLRALREQIAQNHPDAEPVPWETVKRWMRDEDDEGA